MSDSPVRFGLVDQSDPKKALQQLLELDTDGDGVPDVFDKDPHDPKTSSLDYESRPPGDPDVRRAYGLDDRMQTESATYRRKSGVPDTDGDDWSKKVMHAVTKDKGFTFHDKIGDGPKNGFMVSVDQSSEHKVPLRDMTPDRLSDYMSVQQQNLKDKSNYLGGWVHKGNVYLDVSKHVPDREQAMDLARKYKQLGIYDIGKGETLMTEYPDAAKSAFLGALGRAAAQLLS